MNKSQLELALRLAGKIARDRDFIVFGSQSILGTVPEPPGPCLHPQAMALIIAELGARSDFASKNGFFVDCVTPDIAAFPDGWTERLVPFRTRRTGGVTGWCIELHDVVASKLAAGRDKDMDYVRTLLAAKLVNPLVLEDRVSTLPVNEKHRGEILKAIKYLGRKKRPSRQTKK